MKKLLALLGLAALILAGVAGAATTNIAQLPILNVDGTGNVRPNLMLLYDNSGSMASAFTPDYISDSSSCRSRATLANGSRSCTIGQPPFAAAEFNRQYYNPAVRYLPPVYADGTSYPSQTSANTSGWSSVTTDGFNVNRTDLLGYGANQTDLTAGYPDVEWCDSSTCGRNTATYTYPNDVRFNAQVFYGNPYYYNIRVAEYCSTPALTTCVTTAVGAAAPPNYPYPAKVRWCDSKALTNCQAKYVGTFKYPRFSNPNAGVVAAYGTITIGASASAGSITINGVSVAEPGGAVVITNNSVPATTGTNTPSKQQNVANALAASIIAKTGLAHDYLACIRTKVSGSNVPACSSYGITLGTDNVVAVIPVDCPSGVTKSIGTCSLVSDNSRSGWAITVDAPSAIVQPAQPATALIKVSGTAANSNNSNSQTKLTGNTTFGSKTLISSTVSFGRSASATSVATSIRNAITSQNGITAYIAPNAITPACAGATNDTICVTDTTLTTGGAAITMGPLTNSGSISFATTPASAPVAAISDTIPISTTPLGGGGAVFVRVDIVPSVNSYPKAATRTDCAGSTCTYAEEMTNFANWYAYYKTRNQMMKTAVGQAFQGLTSNYNVGIVSLSSAASGSANGMVVPQQFSGTPRTTWYTKLYAMSGNQATPMRLALHAVGKMYANMSPYTMAAGAEVVRYPCQQNFTFVTTDGYWNNGPAADVLNNDNVESTSRFCTRGSGCFDPRDQSDNSLADIALYWYNGGSNTGTSSLRPSLEDMTKPGLVPGLTGDNTRLHMNTYTLGLGVDGIMNYEEKYDTAPAPGGDFYNLITGVTTGCPWNANGAYVWPDPATGDTSTTAYQSRVDDLWHAAINGHGHYFSAADPTQVVEGLSSALSAIQVRVGAASAAATSTPNISQQDNDIFSSTFTTVHWFGEIADRKIDPTTGIVSTDATWVSSDKLGQLVDESADSRTIWMADTVNGGLKSFLYANLTAAEKAWFDNKCVNSPLAQCSSLTNAGRATVNAGANIVNWLRGQQQYADGTLLRAYQRTDHIPAGATTTVPIVLGDIASSKPAYLREPRKGYTLPGYSTFKTDNASRSPTVFVAANDGMLHAFRASDGTELWAYMPRITMKKLYQLASTTYGTNHQYTTDGSPEIADVKIGTAWKSVLVAGLNGGGRGYYALDVTDPAHPRALWELCADATVCTGAHDADIGLTFGNPQFGTWVDGAGNERWVVFLTSGYNNVPGTDNVAGGTGAGFLFVVDVATGQVLNKTSTGNGDLTTPSGFSRITAVTANPFSDPRVTYVYGGDNQGKMYRFDFTAGGAPSRITMGDAGAAQPITTSPEVTVCQVEETDAQHNVTTALRTLVVYGTGRLLDIPDVTNTDLQSVYVLKDTGTGISAVDWRTAAKMAKMSLAKRTVGGTQVYDVSGTTVNWGTQAAWFMDLDRNSGERVNLDPKVVSGTLNVVSNIPTSSSACSVGGTSNLYQLDVCAAKPLLYDANGSPIVGRTLSNSSAAVGFLIIRLPSGALKLEATTADGRIIPADVPNALSQEAHKAGWRRVRD